MASLFGVQPQERERVGWMFLYSVLAVGGLVITGNVVGRTLFLSALPKSAIPLKFILPPLAIAAVASVYSRLANRIRTDRLILGVLATSSIILALFRAGLSTPLNESLPFLCGLFVFFDVLLSIGMLGFWTLAGELFTAREAKRLFGLIAAGGSVSSILFGYLLNWLSHRVASADLIFLILICMLGMAFCTRRLGTLYGDRLESLNTSEPGTSSILDSLKSIAGNKLLLAISLLVVIVAQVSCIADYQFDLAVQEHFGSNSQGMVWFLGNFRLWTGVAAAAIQFFLASHLLSRFGLSIALLLLPTALGLGSVAVLVSAGTLWAILLPRATDLILKYTINQTAFNLLYLPVKPGLQRQGKVLISGVLNPLMVVILGLSFYFVERYLSLPAVYWSIPLLILVVVWLLVARKAARYYVEELRGCIQKREFHTDWDTRALVGKRTLRVLAEQLNHTDTRAVIHTLSLLEELREFDWSDDLGRLLFHADVEVKCKALELVGDFEYKNLLADLTELTNSADIETRISAIRCICRLNKEDSIDQVVHHLECDQAAVRAATITNLMLYAGLDGVLYAAEPLNKLIQSESVEERILGANVLGDLKTKSFHRPLLSLLEDPEKSVRQAAIKAVGRCKQVKLLPQLFKSLEQPDSRMLVSRVLGELPLGRHVVELGKLLSANDTSEATKSALVRAFKGQRTPLAAEILGQQLEQSQGRLRRSICLTLLHLREQGVRAKIPRELVARIVEEEKSRAYELCMLWSEEFSDTLLNEAIHSEFRSICKRLLALLGLKYSAISVGCLKASLYENDDRIRSYGLELMDNVLPRKERKQILPLFSEPISRLQKSVMEDEPDRPKDTIRQLHQLIRSPRRWLRVCTMQALASAGDENDIPCIRDALSCSDDLERDTAWWTLKELTNPDTFAQYCNDNRQHLKGTNFLEALNSKEGKKKLPLSHLEELLFLRTVPLFSALDSDELTSIVPITKEVTFEKGEHLIQEGGEGDCLYVIVEGKVQVSMDGAEVNTCTTPDTLGELSVLAEQPRSADCVAETDVVALRLTKQDFWALMDERPEIAKGVIKTLMRYINR